MIFLLILSRVLLIFLRRFLLNLHQNCKVVRVVDGGWSFLYTQGARVGPGGRDRILAVKTEKIPAWKILDINNDFKKQGGKLWLPVVGEKQWRKIISHTGEKEKKKRKRDKTMVITMAKLRMAHASTHGACKPPGPKEEERAKVSINQSS